MVLKSSKNGVYSGNTLRAPKSGYNRQYRTYSWIVRRFVRHPEKLVTKRKSLLDSFNILAYDVEYSLNKKERWGLPDYIRNYIQDDEIQDEFTKTDLLVRHKLKRQANGVAYYANKGLLKRLVLKSERYFDGKGAVNFQLRRKKKKIRGAEPEDEETQEIPVDTIRYEVFLPCSRFSSLVHNPKYMYIKPQYEEKESASSGGGRKKKKRTRLTSRDIDEMLEFSDPWEDDIRECETPSEDSIVADDILRVKFTLKDFLKPERRPKRKSQRRHSRELTDGACKKTKVFYVEESANKGVASVSNEFSNPKDVNRPALRDSTAICPVVVKLDQNEVAFDSLQTSYGLRYVEARCEPRKFSIDITDRVRAHVKSSGQFQDITPSSLDLTCYLNFTELGSSPDDANLCVYNVCLNLASHMNSIKLVNVLEMETYSINELEARTMSYIDVLPRDVFVKCDNKDRNSEPVMKFELVNKAMKWKVNCIHLQGCWNNDQSIAETNVADVKYEFPSELCNICYDEIRADVSAGDLSAAATCLDNCGHWFCDRCWRGHLVSRLRSGARHLTCPEYECSSAVDFATLLSFLHISDIQKHILRQESEKINSSPQVKWCPMPRCGRAIWVEGTYNKLLTPKNAVCLCGTDLCCTCMKNAHWPATCDQAKRFREMIIALGDHIDLPKHLFIDPLPDAILVKGKSCPNCNRFIEKISGCSNMDCPCGVTFCWICVQVIKPYGYHKCVAKNQRDLLMGAEGYRDHYDIRKTRTRFYNTALKHCRQRQSCILQYQVYVISKRLAVMASKDGYIKRQVLNLQEADNRSFQSILCKFLTRMLSIKFELNSVIAHIAISIDNSPRGNLRIQLQHVLTRMESHVHTIESILERGSLQNLSNVLPKLQEEKASAQRNIGNLSRIMATSVECLRD